MRHPGCGPGFRFGGEQGVESRRVDLGPFKQGPGIAVGIGGIDLADEILRQAAFRFEPVERLERRGGNNAAEIENNRLVISLRHAHPLTNCCHGTGPSSPPLQGGVQLMQVMF